MPNTRKIQVESNKHPLLALADCGYVRIGRPTHALVENSERIMTIATKDLCDFDGKVLVYLEPHHATFGASGTMRSRASSAA